jgi:hypothetical protein
MEEHTARRLAQAAYVVALAVAIAGAIALPAWASEDLRQRPLLTIADGPVQVLRGTQRFEGAEGLLLADDDIVRTTAATRVVRIEFGDGRALDLGPATQVMLLSARTAQAQGWPGAGALALQGWAKFSAGASAGRLVLPQAQAVTEARGVALVHVAEGGAALAFAESGGLTLLPRGGGGADLLLREGETWTRDAASGAVRVSARAAGLREMPRALADTLPRRAAAFDGRAIEAADGVSLDASDLAPWQQAAPQLLAALRAPAATRPAPPRRNGGSSVVARRSARTLPPTLLARSPVLDSAPIELAPSPFLTAEAVDRSASALPLP